MLLTGLRRLLKNLGLAQRRCLYCLTPFTPENRDQRRMDALLCQSCIQFFAPYEGGRCSRCALPLSTESSICGECLDAPPPWQSVDAYGLYQGAIRNAVLRLKFGGEFYLASLLGAFLYDLSRALPLPDSLLPIPQHPQQLRQRGFNQAHEIAKVLSCLTGIPIEKNLLYRTDMHTPQTGLSAIERRRNVQHFFKAAPQVRGLKLWLIDDVMTTGVTLRAAARTLNDANALETRVLVVARTPQDTTNA